MATTFRIDVVVDPRRAVGGTRVVGRELKKTAGAANKLGLAIKAAFAAFVVRGVIRKLSQLTGEVFDAAEAYTRLQNRVRVVTEGHRELTEVTADLFKVARDTRTEFDAVGTIYARTALAVKSLGISQEETLNFTRSLNQAIILSGATAQEASAGAIQLSQALAVGALRGDELRSVNEQLIEVGEVLSRSLGVTRGELKVLGEQGKLTTEVILKAFREARVELDQRFSKSVVTLDQAFTALDNEVTRVVGQFNKQLEVTNKLAKGILLLADSVEVFAVVATEAIPDIGFFAVAIDILGDTVEAQVKKFEDGLEVFKAVLEIRKNLEAFLTPEEEGGEIGDPGGPSDADIARRKAAAEAQALVNKELEAQSELLERIVGPQRDAADDLFRINLLFDAGAISEKQFNDELERLLEILDPLTKLEEKQIELLEEIKGPTEDFALAEMALNNLLKESSINTDEFIDKLAELKKALEDLPKALTPAQQAFESAFDTGLNAAANAILDFAKTGGQNIERFVDQVINALTRLALQEAILGVFGGEAGGFGARFAGSFADGGTFNSGDTFIAGEEGPELITSTTGGRVIPAGETAALAGGQSQPVVNLPPMNVNILNITDPDEVPLGREENSVFIRNVIRQNAREIRSVLGIAQ